MGDLNQHDVTPKLVVNESLSNVASLQQVELEDLQARDFQALRQNLADSQKLLEQAQAKITSLEKKLKKYKKYKDVLKTLAGNLIWDVYGYWLPDWCVKHQAGLQQFTVEPTLKEMCADILKRQKGGKTK